MDWKPPLPPAAQQAQIIRAHQRDIVHVASIREQTENVLRSWLGTRWLARWEPEVDFLVKLVYYGLTTGRASQTLGEEYTDIWQHTTSRERPRRLSSIQRTLLIFLPTFPAYVRARWRPSNPEISRRVSQLSFALQVAGEANLAIFYIWGTYYDLFKRVLGVRHHSSVPDNPHIRPPSYSLLGVLLGVRLLYRLLTSLRNQYAPSLGMQSEKRPTEETEFYIDQTPISSLLNREDEEDSEAKPAEEDERTMLDIASIPLQARASRNCTLCLEERTDSCVTECGHLFCWNCIVGWGREKAECPLCRQSLNLIRLLPIYSL